MYSEYQPCYLLSPYIDKYWEFKGSPIYGTHIHILPDGCTDFIFTLGEVANVIEQPLTMQPYRSYFVGPMNSYSELVTNTETVHMLGIRFLPGGLFRFMNLPLPELTNQRICTNDLITPFDHTFTERLCGQNDLATQINFIESFLINQLKQDSSIDPRVNYAIQLINLQKGQQSIRTLQEDICLCQRHFERKFKQFTGFTPKEYSRIIKFRHAINLLQQAKPVTLLSIALDTGYYDPAHLAKEIKTLSGKPASSFLNPDLPQDVTLTYILDE